MKFSMKLEGMNELRRAVRKAGPDLVREIAPTIKHGAQKVMAEAQFSVPVDRGELAASMFVDPLKVRPNRGFVGTSAGYADPHAPYVHEGFHGPKSEANAAPPQWLNQAVKARREGYVRSVLHAIRKGLVKIQQRMGK